MTPSAPLTGGKPARPPGRLHMISAVLFAFAAVANAVAAWINWRDGGNFMMSVGLASMFVSLAAVQAVLMRRARSAAPGNGVPGSGGDGR